MTKSRLIAILFGALALVAGALLWLQRQSAESLRTEIVLLREQKEELARVRAENERLKAAPISEAELTRLRADRAALLRLRGEVERSRKDVERQERALAEQEAEAKTSTLALSMGADGNLTLDGRLLDEAGLRQRLAGVPAGGRFKVDVYPSSAVSAGNPAKLNETMAWMRMVAKERNLGFRLEIKQPEAPVVAK